LGYFDNEMNLLKLLEFATGFSSIVEFLEEFELSQIEVAGSTKKGVNIMTIHGSKGLEFEHVIVLDRLKGAVPDRSTLLFEYDEQLHIQEIFYKMSGRENFDEVYEALREKQKQLNVKDKMNVLYVALTRAVESMTVIRKAKGSIFDAIGLRPMGRGALNEVVSSSSNETLQVEPLRITHYGTQEVNKEEEEDEKDYEAILFGTAIHYSLEMLSSFSIMALADAMLATKNRFGQQLSSASFEEIKKRVLTLVTSERFQKLLEGATLQNEQAFSFNNELRQIDLLVETEQRITVVEYKSSKKYHLKHVAQVKAYKEAMSVLKRKETRGVIVYLLEGGVEFVGV